MKTHLLAIRKPTRFEKKEHDCDYIFVREDDDGNIYNVYMDLPAYKDDVGSWMQWGQPRSILADNVSNIEKFVRNN